MPDIRSAPVIPNRPRLVAGLAVFRDGSEEPEAFARTMARALEAIKAFPGFRFAIQLQSVDDPGLFGDYVLWNDEASCGGAGELAARSTVCQAYFRATGEELVFAHFSSDGTKIVPDTGRRGEIVEAVHLPVGHPRASPAALREAERSIRTLTGVVAVEAGELAGDIGPGAGIIVVWADVAASEAGARVIAGLFETRPAVALDTARSWRFRARGWFTG